MSVSFVLYDAVQYNGGGNVHPSQYDRQYGERGYGTGSHDGEWGDGAGGYGAAGTVGKTTTRTYTDEEGNIVTEVCISILFENSLFVLD